MAMGVGFSHCEGTPSTWTLAKDDLPIQLETTHSTVGINWDLRHRSRWFRDNDAKIVVTLWAGAVEVFGHGSACSDHG